jgi:hypothetical protein
MPRVFLGAPDVGGLERELLLRAFDDGWIAPAGPDIEAFDREVAKLVGWPARPPQPVGRPPCIWHCCAWCDRNADRWSRRT